MTLVHAADEVGDELLLRVVACVDLGDRAQLGVPAEDEVDGGGRPRDGAGGAVAALVDVLGRRRRSTRCPCRAGCTKKSLRQRARPVGEHSVRRVPGVRAEHPQPADEHRHLRRRQRPAGSPDRPAGAPADACRRVAGSCGTRRRSARAPRTTSTSVCSCDASVRPGENGTVDVVARRPSPPARPRRDPPRTIRSASEIRVPPACAALNSAWIRSSAASTAARSAGSLTSQSFCGARRMRAPLAPPRLSLPRNVDADAHAVDTSCDDGEPRCEDRAP